MDPLSVSLDGLTAVAVHYVLVLGETSESATASAQIAQVAKKVRALRGGAPVILIGHSTAGLGACELAVADVANVRGLITLANVLLQRRIRVMVT